MWVLLGRSEAACAHGRGVALDWLDDLTGELGAKGGVVGAVEVAAQVFTFCPFGEVAVEEALDGCGNVFSGCAVAQRTSRAGKPADGASDAEEEGVDHLAVLLNLFALEADVGDPVLAAGVGAAGDVEADLLIEAGEALFELGDEPGVEALGLGDGELAELGSGAGDGSAPEGGDVDVEAEGVELDDEAGGLAVGHVDDEDVLADGGAQAAVAVLVGEVGELDELVAGEAAVEHGGSDGREAGLALLPDADVVAVDVGGCVVFREGVGIELVAELLFECDEEGFGGPAVAHEEVLDASAGAVLAEVGLLLEDADDGGDDLESFVLRDKGRDSLGDVRLGREAAADAEGVADLFDSVTDRSVTAA